MSSKFTINTPERFQLTLLWYLNYKRLTHEAQHPVHLIIIFIDNFEYTLCICRLGSDFIDNYCEYFHRLF